MRAKARERARQHDERMSLAWHTAALVMQGLAGSLPPLASLLHAAKPRRASTAEEVTAGLFSWLGSPSAADPAPE